MKLRILPFMLALLSSLVSAQPFAPIEHSEGIRYRQLPQEQLEAFADQVRPLLETTGEWSGESVLVGPFLWSQLVDLEVFSALKEPPAYLTVPVGDRLLIAQGQLMRENSTRQSLTQLMTQVLGPQTRYRRIEPDELSLLWSLVPFDLEDPILVAEGEGFEYVILFNEEKGFMLEDVSDPSLIALAELPMSKTDQDVLLPSLELSSAQYYLQKEMLEKALHHFRRAALNTDDKEIEWRGLLGMGKVQIYQNDLEDGLTSLNNALRLNPDSAEALYWRALGYLQLRDGAKALSDLEKMESLQGEESTAEFAFQKANALLVLERYQDAVAMYEACLRQDPSYESAKLNIASALLYLDKPAQALAMYDKFLQSNPKSAPAWNNHGYCLARMGRYQEALESIDRALELSPRELATLDSRAYALVGLKRYSEARAVYDTILKRDPKAAKAYYGRSVCLRELEQSKAADEDMKEALRLKPGLKLDWVARSSSH